MRSPFTPLATLLLAAAALPASAGSPFTIVPVGTPVRMTCVGCPSPVRGTLASADGDSLRVLPAHGGAAFAVANGAVRSLDYRSGRRSCGRLDVLLGIGVGMAGGGVLGAALGGDNQEGGGGNAPAGGGGDRASETGDGSSAVSATTLATPSASTAYRAVMGAVLGGLVGGVLGNHIKVGFQEDVWSTVPGPVSRALGVPSSAARRVFTVRIPL